MSDAEFDTTQFLMDKAYARWQHSSAKNWSYMEFLSHLPQVEKYVVVIGNLNYQVENGGFSQWHGNGYSDSFSLLQAALDEIGTPTAEAVFDIVKKVMDVFNDRDSDQDDGYYSDGYYSDGEEVDEEVYEYLDKLDDKYYSLKKQLLTDVEAWVKKKITPANESFDLLKEMNVPTPNEDGVKYPHITVKLVGEDGNAFAVLGKVLTSLRRAGVSESERKQFQDEATRSDYDHLIQTVMQWVNVE